MRTHAAVPSRLYPVSGTPSVAAPTGEDGSARNRRARASTPSGTSPRYPGLPACCIAGIAAFVLTAAPLPAGAASEHAPFVLAKDAAPAARKGPPPLRGTYWKLIALSGKPARTFKDQREPHLVLDGNDTRASGSGGCNNVVGGFEQEGERLRFTQMAGTMMMCPEGMEQEAAFLKALEQAARFRLAGDALTLVDAKGKAIAKFRAGVAR